MKNPKIEVSFENRILSVKFLDNAVIANTDIEELYEFGKQKASGKPYCIIFEPVNHYDVTEDAIEYIVNNPYSKYIVAKAYVVNSKEAEMKTRAHLLFDHPDLKPFTFKTLTEGKNWLMEVLNKGNS
jgi:hypothetical protein